MNSDHAIWSRPALLEQVLHPRRDGRMDVALHVAMLGNARRTLMLQSYLESRPGVVRVKVDVHARRLRVTFHPEKIDLPRLLDACLTCACPARPLRRECMNAPYLREADVALKRLAVAGLFTMQAMMFALVLYLGVIDTLDASTTQLFRWLEMLAATPVIGYAAVPFFRHALADLRQRRAGIDVPIALAVVMVYAASVFNTVRGHGHIWFDSAAMLTFVLLLGRYLELRARCRQQALNAAAADAVPMLAARRAATGQFETVAAMELVAGDIVHVSEGTRVPADGMLVCANARMDTSHQDGESRLRTVRRGGRVSAGSLVLDAPIEMEVTHAGNVASAVRMQHLASDAARQRARTDPADSILVGRFMVGVIGLAGVTAAFWSWHDPTRAFDAVIAVLVVACPCAFALATPATLTRAMTILARHGIGLTRPRALPALANIDHALIDKTGTLTQPALDLAHIKTFGAMTATPALELAAALARGSSHPISQALLRAHTGHLVSHADDIHMTAGGGLRGNVDGQHLILGRAGFACPEHADDDALWLANEHGPLARFSLTETLRPGAMHAMRALRSAGIEIEIVSGDSAARVAAIAARLGIRQHRSRQRPQDKYQRVHDLQDAGHRVLVIGDGSNDAAALAAADVSASLAGATDLARQYADLVLGENLEQLSFARHLAIRALHTTRLNRRWGLAWNIAAIPLAAAGVISPWLAALGMSLSSLAVVVNALRLAPPCAPSTRISAASQMEGQNA